MPLSPRSYPTIDWEMVQGLVIVYSTINASIGNWLLSARREFFTWRSETTWARYTAITWPATIRATCEYHTKAAPSTALFTW